MALIRRSWHHIPLPIQADVNAAQWLQSSVSGLDAGRAVVERTRVSVTAWGAAGGGLAVPWYPQDVGGANYQMWLWVEAQAGTGFGPDAPPAWPSLVDPSADDFEQPTVVASMNPVLQQRQVPDTGDPYMAWVAHLPTAEGDSAGQRSFTAGGGGPWNSITAAVQVGQGFIYDGGSLIGSVPFTATGLCSFLVSWWD